MRRSVLAAAFCAAAFCAAAAAKATAADRRKPALRDRTADFKPRAAAVYEGDPQAERKLRIETLFGIYLVDPPRRHASERVELEARRATLLYWQPSGGFTDAELQTRATAWGLLGRTQFSSGARGLFSEFPELDEVVIVFHDVLRKNQKGRRLADETVVPYLRVRLTRARFDRLKLKPVEACADKGDCAAVFRVAFDEARFDRKGLKAR